MRASTLATLEVVSTVPETTSPACATGVLIDIASMCGGALGGSTIGLTEMTCGASVAATTGPCEGDGAADAEYGPTVGGAVRTGEADAGPLGDAADAGVGDATGT